MFVFCLIYCVVEVYIGKLFMVGNDILEVVNIFEGFRCFYWVLFYIFLWEVRFMKIKGINVYMLCGWNWFKL